MTFCFTSYICIILLFGCDLQILRTTPIIAFKSEKKILAFNIVNNSVILNRPICVCKFFKSIEGNTKNIHGTIQLH